MKKTIALLTVILFTLSSKSQTLDCKYFKTGKFYYPDIPGKISIRKDSTQESYDGDKLAMLWNLKWKNDCEYEMVCDQVMSENISIKKGDRIVATIIKTEGECFTTSLIYYNSIDTQGLAIPSITMCFKNN